MYLQHQKCACKNQDYLDYQLVYVEHVMSSGLLSCFSFWLHQEEIETLFHGWRCCWRDDTRVMWVPIQLNLCYIWTAIKVCNRLAFLLKVSAFGEGNISHHKIIFMCNRFSSVAVKTTNPKILSFINEIKTWIKTLDIIIIQYIAQ